MQAFHNDNKVKLKYVERMKRHIEMDNLIRGEGWTTEGKGCAVGCTLEAYDHKKYETELGIPQWLARVEDRLFEGMSEQKSKNWPLLFLEAVNVGSDLEKIKGPFLIFILQKCLTYFDNKKFPECVEAISRVIDLWVLKGEGAEVDEETFREARSLAYSARRSAAAYADAAYADAAYADAAYADAAYAAADAAYAAAYAYAAYAAAYAYAYAAYAAAYAYAAADAYRSARTGAFNEYADKLLELIHGCR